MIIISHRGNLNGPEPDFENNPERIDLCIKLGLQVEIDLWLVNNNKLFLGHDEPQYEIEMDFLYKRRLNLWIHCKNIESLSYLTKCNEYEFNYFWHQNDEYTITSNKFIWTFPKDSYDTFFSRQIILDFSSNIDYNYYKEKCIHAICCDYVSREIL